MGFAYPPHGIYIQFPLITQNFHIFDMHDFKAFQDPASVHHSQLFSHNSYNKKCVSLHKPKLSHLYHF